MKQRVFFIIFTGIFLAAVGTRPLRAANAVVGDCTPASCNEDNFNTTLNTVQSSGGGTTAISFIAGVYPDGPDMVPEIFQGIGLFLVALATTTVAAQETAVPLGAAS